MWMQASCRCGCGEHFTPSRTTAWRIRKGEPIGYIKGHELRGERNPNWKGGTISTSNGYRMVLRPDHPNAMKNGYILEHRLVASEALGRPLKDREVVHHNNGQRDDNEPDNLTPMEERAHKRAHFSGVHNPKWKGGIQPKRCAGCGTFFVKKCIPTHWATRFCSKSCMHASMRGELAANVKLTDVDVAAIRARRGTPQRTLAARFGISKTQVGRILRGESR